MRLLKVFIVFIGMVSCMSNGFAASPKYIAYADSADYYIRQEKWGMAEQMILNALRLEPANRENYILLNNLGEVRMRENRLNEAIESFSLGLNLAPRSVVLLTNRGAALMAVNDRDGALADFDRALQSDSTFFRALRLRGYLRLVNKDLKGATSDFKQLLTVCKEKSDSVGAYAGLGEVAFAEGNNTSADTLFSKALELDYSAELLMRRGWVRLAAERLTEAFYDASEAIGIDGSMAEAYILRGYLYRRRLELREAEADRKRAIILGAEPELIRQFFE